MGKTFLMVEFKYLTWDEVMDLSIRVAELVAKDGYRPDVVIGIARGGIVVAKIIEDILGVGNMSSIEIKLYEGIGRKGENARIVQPLTINIEGMRVLLVDDVSDTGTTLEIAYNYLRGFRPSEIRTATLMVKPWTRFKPNYYAGETSAWIIFPWEVGETIRELGNRAELAFKNAKNRDVVVKIRSIVQMTTPQQ